MSRWNPLIRLGDIHLHSDAAGAGIMITKLASCHWLGHAAPEAGTARSESPWDGPCRLQPLSCTAKAVSAGIRVGALGWARPKLTNVNKAGLGVNRRLPFFLEKTTLAKVENLHGYLDGTNSTNRCLTHYL